MGIARLRSAFPAAGHSNPENRVPRHAADVLWWDRPLACPVQAAAGPDSASPEPA